MRFTRHTLLYILIVVTTTCTTQLVAAPPAKATIEAQVANWIAQLDDDDFATRELAMQRLVDAGAVSVGPIEAALPNANLEVLNRGMSILRKLSLTQSTADVDHAMSQACREAAVAALQRLASSPSPLVARHAHQAQVSITVTQEEIAARTLRVFGGQVQKSSDFNGQPRVEVEIGKSWRGRDADLAQVRHLPGLYRLTIKHAKITDASIQQIANLTQVQYVDLMYVNVTDEGVEHLKRLPSLVHCRLYGTRITENGQRELAATMERRGVQTSLPGGPVDYRQGAFLGVSCLPDPSPCLIREVTPDSAAEDAGLEPGDIITKYDAKPVRKFEDLRSLIGLNRAGESKKIVVFRTGEPQYRSQQLTKDDKLGITGTSHSIGVLVTKVEKGSLAATWELKEGDIILSFNREQSPTAEGLQEHFDAQIKAVAGREDAPAPEPPRNFGFRNPFVNDTCTITFARNAKEIEKTVTFGEWEF